MKYVSPVADAVSYIGLFMAAALDDLALAERLVTEDRGCLSHRIGKPPEFPPVGYRGRGGTIYQWTLRFIYYLHQIALIKGHQPMFDFLYGANRLNAGRRGHLPAPDLKEVSTPHTAWLPPPGF